MHGIADKQTNWRVSHVLAQARLVIVTGARPQVSALLQQAGIKEEFREDLRVTSKDTLKVTGRHARRYRDTAVEACMLLTVRRVLT